ncbi:MAG: hypothetical protein CMM50_17540 [Rhodospirillaceae bacterium]|nr:hypothetical protein [Rhodospirillaceae bacterium]|tara:strand:- start:842 stop:1423 length:582 start_codon:yes stop_codon:yes gene_type:complete
MELAGLLTSGRQALDAGDLDTALYFYRAAIGHAPEDRDALMGYAAVSRAGGDREAAHSAYRSVLATHPDDIRAALQLAGLTAETDPGAAVRALEALKRTDPDDPALLAQLAQTQERMGMIDDALHNLRRAVELASGEPAYRLNLALLLDRMGRGADALPHYRSVLDAAYRGTPLATDIGAVEARYAYLAGKDR